MRVKKRRSLRATPIFFIFLSGMLLGNEWEFCLSLLLGVLLHECGHLLAARILHIPMKELRLDLFGARLSVKGQLVGYFEEWMLAAAGPLASLFFAALAVLFWDASSFFQSFSAISLILGLVNLLPIASFDGGRMLSVLLALRFGDRVCRNVQKITSFLFLFFLFSISVYLLLRAGGGLSLFCFSMSLFARFFQNQSFS